MNCCFVTVVTKSRYEVTAGRLYQALKYFNSKYPLEILVSDQLTGADLPFITKNNIPYRLIKPISFINSNTPGKNLKTESDSRFDDTISKIHMLSLYEYDYVCFIDADSMITANIDAIFDIAAFKEPFAFTIVPENPWNIKALRIEGEFILAKPSEEAFNEAYNNYLKIDDNLYNSIHTDESYFEYFYPKCIHRLDKDFIDQRKQVVKNVIHLSGPIKLWEYPCELLTHLFYEVSIEEFIKASYELTKLHYKWVSLTLKLDNYIRNFKFLYNQKL